MGVCSFELSPNHPMVFTCTWAHSPLSRLLQSYCPPSNLPHPECLAVASRTWLNNRKALQLAAVNVTSGVSYEVLDLRHFMGRALRPLLEAEERVWATRLHWDYHPSAKLLLQYLDSRMLPGYAAVDTNPGPGPGRVAAYAFCVYEDTKAVIGDVFADPDIEQWKPPATSFIGQSPLEIEENLLRH